MKKELVNNSKLPQENNFDVIKSQTQLPDLHFDLPFVEEGKKERLDFVKNLFGKKEQE